MEDLSSRAYRSAVLWVLAANHRARRFYERAGFREEGKEKVETIEGHILREVRYRRDLTVDFGA